MLRVLDERGQVDCSIGAQGESARTVRDKVETARALESLPAIAQVAMEGGFSDEQLRSVVQVGRRGVGSGVGGAGAARRIRSSWRVRRGSMSKPTAEDSRARSRGAVS